MRIILCVLMKNVPYSDYQEFCVSVNHIVKLLNIFVNLLNIFVNSQGTSIEKILSREEEGKKRELFCKLCVNGSSFRLSFHHLQQ